MTRLDDGDVQAARALVNAKPSGRPILERIPEAPRWTTGAWTAIDRHLSLEEANRVSGGKGRGERTCSSEVFCTSRSKP